ncbi:MAG: alkaline phosphatase family protein [Candidatus Dormibacteria bacterium]
MTFQPTRRDVLKAGAAAGLLGGLGHDALLSALTAEAACNTSLAGLKHVVFLIQENRSFDNYFGSYKGVRGFGDTNPRFAQAYATPASPTGYSNPLKPFRVDTSLSLPPHQGVCTNDVEHQWAGQHDTWNHGLCDNWMNSHLATDPTAKQAAMTMGHYTRPDLPFYYALADNFTICDNYFSSVIGGTDINRLYTMTATCDPDAYDGGCQFLNTKVGTIENPGANLGAAGRWKPYPQHLTEAGISWKCYGTADGQLGDNPLRYFPQFRPSGGKTSLSVPAFGSQALVDFAADCQAGTLPSVSWIFTGLVDTEHPPDPITWGESITHTLLTALVTSGMWASTALLLTYDENGGFFDHVVPPTAPAGTGGEYLNQAAMTATAKSDAKTTKGVDKSGDPIGLGFRVPMLVISPFSRNSTPSGGPLMCSDRFDHTSMLRLVETLTGVRVPDRDPGRRIPGLSPWRRSLVGDLSSAFNIAAAADSSVPTSLLGMVPNRADPRVLAQCIITGTPGTLGAQPIVQDPVVPAENSTATQEPLPAPVKRPSGPVGGGTLAVCIQPTPSSSPPATTRSTAGNGGTPNTSRPTDPGAAVVIGLAAAGAAAAWWHRRRVESAEVPPG